MEHGWGVGRGVVATRAFTSTTRLQSGILTGKQRRRCIVAPAAGTPLPIPTLPLADHQLLHRVAAAQRGAALSLLLHMQALGQFIPARSPSRTSSGCTPHSFCSARSAMHMKGESGRASHQSPMECTCGEGGGEAKSAEARESGAAGVLPVGIALPAGSAALLLLFAATGKAGRCCSCCCRRQQPWCAQASRTCSEHVLGERSLANSCCTCDLSNSTSWAASCARQGS